MDIKHPASSEAGCFFGNAFWLGNELFTLRVTSCLGLISGALLTRRKSAPCLVR